MNTIAQDLQETLKDEFTWFSKLVHRRIRFLVSVDQLNRQVKVDQVDQVVAIPALLKKNDIYHQLAKEHKWDTVDRVLILLSLSPYLAPNLLKILEDHSIHIEKFTGDQLKNKESKNFVLNFKVALFLLAGNNDDRLPYLYILQDDYKLFRDRILDKKENLLDYKNGETLYDLPLIIGEEFLQQITTGETYDPDYSVRFPARKVTTHYTWDDLKLDEKVMDKVLSMASWIKHLDKIQEDEVMSKEIKGYKAILYGPPGTGKSLSVKIIGKERDLPVYRIDLSMVVSKYIGETEKNLSFVFDLAERRNWILFFDEGDALFGKRAQTKSSQDRYANQEVSYLLQRMEDHPGVIILATNKLKNIDEAFLRRFQTQIYFPKSSYAERVLLWTKAFGGKYQLEDPAIIDSISKTYEISAAEIINVKHFAVIKALSNNCDKVKTEDLMTGLQQELEKSGKIL